MFNDGGFIKTLFRANVKTYAKNKLLIGILAAMIFVVGVGYIVYMGRPVMNQPNTLTETSAQTGGGESQGMATSTATEGAKTYSMSDVQAHGTQADCWSTIGGDVYDLTSWVSRHPGGPGPIIGLCGNDGTEAFTKKHGRSREAKSMLVLLKIGSLK